MRNTFMGLRLCAGAFVLASALLGSAACADTLEELRAQAAQPLEATVEAYGRTIELSVSAQVPDAEAMGVYLATVESGNERKGMEAESELPQKRRGIAFRTRPTEIFTPQTLPEDYHAFGHPITGREAIDSVWTLLEPHVAQADGVTAQVTEVKGWSPYYYYDKTKGEWGDVAVEGSVGTYHIEYEVSLNGAPVLDNRPFSSDPQAYWHKNSGSDWMLYVRLDGSVGITREGEPCPRVWYSLPQITQTLAQDVDLAPLERIYGTLTALAEEGNLRQAYWLRLCYEGFSYGERPEDWVDPQEQTYLVKPVWVCYAEVYRTPEEEAALWPDGTIIENEEHIVIDAQTGELIECMRVVSY